MNLKYVVAVVVCQGQILPAVIFPEACVLLSPLGVKWEKDEEAQKRIATFAKIS